MNDLKLKGGGTLQFGPRVYRIASPIVVNGVTIRFQGQGFTEGPAPGQGTWLRITTTGFTPFTFTGVLARGSAVADIAVQQSHTASQVPGWAPTNYDYVFRVEDCFGGVDFDNVYLCAVNRGIYARNSGRVDIRRLRGQVFTVGVEIDECYDVPRLHNVHFWTFWTSNINVIRWQQANGDTMIFRRCDGVFIDQAFALGYRSMFRFASSAAGFTQKFYIGQAYTDFTLYGLLIEANGTDGQVANLTHHGDTLDNIGPIAGGIGVYINASNTRVQIANLRIDSVENSPIRVNGFNNRLDIFALRCVRFNVNNNASPALLLGNSGAQAPNAVYLGSPPLLEQSNNAPVVNAGGNAILALGAPAGVAARPGLSVGATNSGLFQPATGALAAAAGGAEVLRATSAGAVTLGAAPGSHALEVATPAAAANRLLVSGAGTGSAVTLQAQGLDTNIDLTVTGKGSGLLRTATPATADNSTAVATTAWVRLQGLGGGGGAVSSVAGRTGDVTLSTTDVGGFATAASAAAPVQSVAGRTGTVTLTTADVGGFATAAAAAAPVQSVAGRTGTVTLTTTDVGGFATAAAAAAPVQSVAGRTGTVTLAVADVAGAAPLASPAFTGTPTAPTVALADTSTAIATTAWVRGQGYGTGGAGTLPAPVVQSGKWLVPPVSAIATAAVAANTLYLSPLPVWEAMTLDRLGLRVSTGVAGNCKLGAYRWDATNQQFALVAGSETGVVLTNTAAVIVGTPGTSIVLTQPTLLWIASTFDATPTVTTWSAAAANGGGFQTFIAQDETAGAPNASVLTTNGGFARLARTAALTWSGGAVTLPATIAATDLTRAATSPGSPIGIARRA
ncbi:hypothetical protein [Paracraurococcus ruber]|uniref:Uncharacterized protein n=1 Tax=Paracraurococcus ruber TaxID=77675 RepID=A0ABS1CRH7_9PROT|nr:hypothetical protein [Paracraurococcus ruber]MBK1656945.1 hypothetical protein [Paracraurococcus ruber]